MSQSSWSREPSEDDRTLEENWLFRLRRERFRSRHSGQAHDYYVLHLADAVNVIAVTPEDRLILVRQFRAGSGKDSLETPGGLIDPGEDPRIAGARELREETGYAGEPPILVGTVWSNPSLMSSRITTILVTNARRVAEPSLDHGEEVRVEFAPARSIPRMIREGEIDHALAVQGLLWWLAGEIPGSPLATPSPGRGRRQFRIATLMYLVAVSAIASSVWTRLDSWAIPVLIGVMVLPAAGVITALMLDPLPRSTLLRPMNRTPRRSFLRLMAVLGLTLTLGMALLLACGVLGLLRL